MFLQYICYSSVINFQLLAHILDTHIFLRLAPRCCLNRINEGDSKRAHEKKWRKVQRKLEDKGKKRTVVGTFLLARFIQELKT